MQLHVLGSSSSGNCYVLQTATEALILEAGIHPREVKRALGYDLRKVAACLITHRHGDHAQYTKQMLDLGLRVLAPADVWESKGINAPRAKAVTARRGYKVGRFKVYAFEASHDVPCVGYHIEHPELGRLLFLTDSTDLLQLFPDLDHILIECNYSLVTLLRAIEEGRTPAQQLERLRASHMELETCKEALADLDLAKVQEIILLHLSNNNSDRKQLIKEIQRCTGRPTYLATAGLTMELTPP